MAREGQRYGYETALERGEARLGKARLQSLEDLDGRTLASRKARAIIAGIESDLGTDEPSTAQRQLAQRAALLGVICEDLETQWLANRPADLGLLGTLADRQRRILEALGLRRMPRDVTPRRSRAQEQALQLLREGAR